MINLFVVDNFYPKPYELREFALKQDFNVDGNYPGHRTRSFLRDIDYQLDIISYFVFVQVKCVYFLNFSFKISIAS